MDTVYQPAEDSFLLLESLQEYLKTADRKPKTALDMGTGSGILAIAAAKRGCSVTAADINPEAVTAAKENAKKECVKIDFVESDLFSKINGKFDLIIFNPPYVKTKNGELKADMASRAWAGGKDGLTVVSRFLKDAPRFLRPGGKIILMVSSSDDVPPAFSAFKSKILSKKPLFFERLFVLELT